MRRAIVNSSAVLVACVLIGACIGWGRAEATQAAAQKTTRALTTYGYFSAHGEAVGGAYFGTAVASAGDVNGDGYADVLVGDDGYDSGRGRAYLYYGGTTKQWLNPASDLVFAGEDAGDHMGYSVASAGDLNGDGYDDIIVGALNYSGAGVNAGRAYVFFGGAAMDNTPDLVMTGQAPFSYFGYSVSGAGDLNHDGYADFVVGAYGFENQRGRVYVYWGGTSPDAVADFTTSGKNDGDRFGFCVAAAGDVNGDKISDLLVGAPGYGSLAGRGYLFLGSAAPDTTEDQVYTGENAGDWFGTSLCGAGDVDGDGYADLLIGAPNYSGNTGKAYVYRGGSSLSNVATATGVGEKPDSYFGFSVASLGDANRDGLSDVMIGAPQYASNGGLGRIYYYYNASDLTWSQALGPGANASTGLGWSVAGAGDVDGDGYRDLIYGEPSGGAGGRASVDCLFPYRVLQPNGAEQWVVGQTAHLKFRGFVGFPTDVWLSRDGGGSWTKILSGWVPSSYTFVNLLETDITVPGPATPAALIRVVWSGLPVELSTSDQSDCVFDIVDATAPTQAALQPSAPKISTLGATTFDFLGASLAGGSDWNADGFADVVTSAPGTPGTGNPGHAYLYRGGPKADGVFDVTFTGEAADDQFGSAVAFTGDLNADGYADLAIGARTHDAAGANAGRVYVYFGGPSADAVADLVLDGPSAGSELGASVAGTGDVNGDGYADLLVGSGYDVGAGTAYLYFGGPGMDASADLSVYEGPGFGAWISGVGDVNQDGFADFIVGAPSFTGEKGKAFLYYGGSTPDPTADITLSGGASFGQSVSGTGDVNGDGYADLVVGEPDVARALVYFGGPSLDPAGNRVLSGSPGGGFGTSVAGAGDVNGDSFADLLIGEPYNGAAGRAQVFFGGPGMDASADMSITTSSFGGNALLGFRVARGGDFVGDGFNDLLIGAPGSGLNGTYAGGVALWDVNRYHMLGPNGGETWQVGSSKTISWYGSEPADLLLSVDGGQSYQTLAANVGGKEFNSLGILVPHAPTKFARLKLTPSNLQVPPSPVFPPSPIFPPSPVYPPSPIIAGGDQSDSLFTINASVSLLALMAAPAPEGTGAVITWNTDPGPENLAGYRVEKATGDSPWRTLATTKATRVEDPQAGPATRYRLFSVDGLQEELYLGETSFRPRAPLAAWPLPYRGGKLSISFATSGGLGGAAGRAEVAIFDVQGRLVRRLAQGLYPAGYQSVEWDGRDQKGCEIASGVYLMRSSTGGAKTTMKLVVAR